jgi:DNA-binding NarL/FixJ family response regulator
LALTEREKEILRLSRRGLSDYRISRSIKADPPTVIRSHRNALKKISRAEADLAFASEIGLSALPAKEQT